MQCTRLIYYLQNIQQVLKRLQATLAHDPCRRFALGATIEGTSMRLWVYSRSMIIASETLDFCSVSYYISFVGITSHLSVFAYDIYFLGYQNTN